MTRIAGWAILILCARPELLAQPVVTVLPLVGCPSDGQTGPRAAPRGVVPPLDVSRADAALAYYQSAAGIGILAPRGWHCVGTYGSGGDTLFVTPQAIPARDLFSPGHRLTGPAIQVSHRFGDTSGRTSVAEVVARVFPAKSAFVDRVMRDFDLPPGRFPTGPYPTDVLTDKSPTVVEYRTPARADGLGTHSWLAKNDEPIDGVAILVGEAPDLLLLSARLPRELRRLVPAIMHQLEIEASRRP